MPTTKKSPTKRRTTGAAKTKKRRRISAAPSPAKKSFAGVMFSKLACGLTKPEATKRAKNKRAAGGKARVVKNTAGKGYCLYARAR